MRARTLTAATAALALGGAGAGCASQGGKPHANAFAASAPAITRTAGPSASPARSRSAQVTLTVPAANHAFGSPRVVTVPHGWTAEVWTLVRGARFETWTPGGELLVSSPADGSVTELTPWRARRDPPRAHTVLSNLDNPQGMAFARLGGQEYLFVAESDEIDRYAWRGAAPGARAVIVHDLPEGGAHPLKNVIVAPDHTVLFDIGSATNADPPSGTTPPRGTVVAVDPDGRHLRVFARGVRNGDGLSFAPDGTLWAAVNERDDIAYPFHRSYGGHADAFGDVIQSYVNDHPADELARLTAGRNLGWPYCDPDPDVQPGRARTAYGYANMRFDADAQTNAGGRVMRCAALTRIQRGLPAHSAPLGFNFLQRSRLPRAWREGAVVAIHGSWDRQPPRAPGVLWLPWQSRSRTLGAPITVLSGFQDSSGGRWGRPVDAVPGPDGALYVTDDQAGAIYRLVPR